MWSNFMQGIILTNNDTKSQSVVTMWSWYIIVLFVALFKNTSTWYFIIKKMTFISYDTMIPNLPSTLANQEAQWQPFHIIIMKLQTVSKVETRPINNAIPKPFQVSKKIAGRKMRLCKHFLSCWPHDEKMPILWWKNIVLLIIFWAVSQRPDLIEARTHKFSIHIPYFLVQRQLRN